MAVKHGCRDSADETRLNNIKRVLETIEQQKQSSGSETISLCEKIVMYLGMIPVPSNAIEYKKFMESITKLKDYLINAIATQELIVATLHALYKEISNPEKQPTPTMSIVLFLIERQHIPKAVKVILNNGCQEASLEQALHTLCTWLSKWTQTPNLGPLVSELMKGLEVEQHYDILLNITSSHVEHLFKLLILKDSRDSIGPVVFHMLRCMQHSQKDFHKIIPQVPPMLESLKRENTPSSKELQQTLIGLCMVLLDRFPDNSINDQLTHTLEKFNAASHNSDLYKSWSDNANTTVLLSCFLGKVGLNNLGNTCYMNSVLQALFMTKTFRNDVLQSMVDGMPVFSKLQTLFALLQFSERASLSPSDIANIARPPGFQPGHQHDSSEFLGYLLDILHEMEKSMICQESGNNAGPASPSPPTVVKCSFGGKSLTLSLCNGCLGKSEHVDTFRELQLSFPNTTENQSVQTLLDYYLQPEKLSGDNQYHCDYCEGLTDGERVTSIIEPPQRLILTLKHFRYDPATQLRTKLLQRVHLDNNIILDNHQYQLYAAVVHCGSSVDSGHYYTYAKEDEVWYKFNDCFVNKSSAGELCGLRPPEAPYILFYRRSDCKDPDTLNKLELSPELLSVIVRDAREMDAEKRRPQQTLTFDRNRHNRDDDPPPPGCGGGGFMDSTHSRFVC